MSCTDVWVQNRCQIILETHQTGERLIILNVDEVRLSLWQWGVGHISKISKAPLEQMWKHILVSTCGFSHLAFKAELHMTVRNIWFLCLIVQKKKHLKDFVSFRSQLQYSPLFYSFLKCCIYLFSSFSLFKFFLTDCKRQYVWSRLVKKRWILFGI